MRILHFGKSYAFNINQLRDTWFLTSARLDSLQCGQEHAAERFANYAKQPLRYQFQQGFVGTAASYGIDARRRTPSGLKAAIIREKGVNGDREMAYSLYYAGFDVKDVHMTDLMTGRETLDDINMIVFVGGFSNSDVLGSAKGWAGAFLFNETARTTLERFYARKDTLSLGVCNGCQVMTELGLVYPFHDEKPKMKNNKSGKFESGFISVDIPENRSVMFGSLVGARLGVWVAHGEGQFHLPKEKDQYQIAAYYSYQTLPGNPNGSDYGAAAIVSDCGRHLAIMPHIERSLFPWQWAYYPDQRSTDEVGPWIEAFVNARKWVELHK
jgi:phosphoribosylformylglycinamidine synthase